MLRHLAEVPGQANQAEWERDLERQQMELREVGFLDMVLEVAKMETKVFIMQKQIQVKDLLMIQQQAQGTY